MALSSPFAMIAQPLSIAARRGKWFPVGVTLSNMGDPVKGDLRLRLVPNGGFDLTPNDFHCEVDLPTNARKVVWLYGRMERPNIGQVEISFSGRGFPAVMQRAQIQEPEEGQRLVITIADTDSGLGNALKSLRGTGFSLSGASSPAGFNPNTSQGPLRALQASHTDVPDRWFGFDGADMVILGDFAHSSLAPPQIEALHGYVAGGGNLLAMGGSNAPRLAASPLADLWPSQISASRTANATEVGDLVHRYVETVRGGADRLGGSPVVVTRGALKPGAQLLQGTASAPLFAASNEGAGRVLFLSYDPSQPPFVGWSGQNGLWRDIFAASLKPRRFESTDSSLLLNFPNFPNGPGSYYGNGNTPDGVQLTATGRLLSALARAPQLQMPPVSQIAWFLALYVFVLVPLNYAVLRFIDRRELAWISIPVIVAAFSLFAYSAALSIRGKAILTRQVEVVQGSLGSKSARSDSLLWLFSPRRTSYDISSSLSNATVADYANEAGGKQGSFSILQPADASALKIEGAGVWMWTDRSFASQGIADLKKGLSLSGMSIKNDSPFDLQGAVWVENHQVRALGTLKSGGSSAIPMAASEIGTDVDLPGAIMRASHIESIFRADTLSNGIPTAALTAALGDNFGRQNEGAMLIGWTKTSVAPLSIGVGGARTSDLSLVVLRAMPGTPSPLPATRGAAMEAIVKHAGFEPDTTLIPGTNASGIEFYECLLPTSKNWVLKLSGTDSIPSGSPLSLQPGVKPAEFKVEMWNASRNLWSMVTATRRRDKSPGGNWSLFVPVPAEFLRQPDRFLRLKVRRPANIQITTVKVVR